MITVMYDPYIGHALPDGKVEKEVERIIDYAVAHSGFAGVYSTENIFVELRLAVVEGRIPHTSIQFVFKDEVLKINEYGSFDPWPDEFLDHNTSRIHRILNAGFQRRMVERAEANNKLLRG